MKVSGADEYTYEKISRNVPLRDFETLKLKSPECGEFETFEEWRRYLFEQFKVMGWMPEYCNDFRGSIWRFITGKAEEVRKIRSGQCGVVSEDGKKEEFKK